MDIAKNEIAVLEAAVEISKSSAIADLSELELAFVGGGIGDVVGH